MRLSIWPDLVSRDFFVTGLGSLQLRNSPQLMPSLQRKEDEEKRLETGLVRNHCPVASPGKIK